jgi:hypothetical protein
VQEFLTHAQCIQVIPGQPEDPGVQLGREGNLIGGEACTHMFNAIDYFAIGQWRGGYCRCPPLCT